MPMDFELPPSESHDDDEDTSTLGGWPEDDGADGATLCPSDRSPPPTFDDSTTWYRLTPHHAWHLEDDGDTVVVDAYVRLEGDLVTYGLKVREGGMLHMAHGARVRACNLTIHDGGLIYGDHDWHVWWWRARAWWRRLVRWARRRDFRQRGGSK